VKKKLLIASILALLSQTAVAESSQEVNLLKQQIKLLTERLDNLEQQATNNNSVPKTQDSVVAATPSPDKKSAKPSIADRLTFKADFRDRYEIIDQQGKPGRERNRVRLRAALSMKVDDALSITLGTATGGDDPVSTNQTLGGAGSTKDLRLDLAYFTQKFSDTTKLIGGKMKNPFFKPGKNPTFWDSDYNPEGFAFSYHKDGIKGTLVGFSIDERKKTTDALMLGGQLLNEFKVSQGGKIIAGLGYYDYSGVQGYSTLHDTKARGNSLDANGNYLTDFNIVETFVEYKTKMNSQPFALFVNYFDNTAAQRLNTSYVVGVKVGKVKAAGSWDIGLNYQDTEADAVIGLFNDSDFAGGHTDSKGFTLKAGYGIKKNVKVGLAYINSEFGQSLPTQTKYNRLQLDFKVKFK